MSMAYKIPQSVLVMIYTQALDVLLIKRSDVSDYWQSVTGSRDDFDEPLEQTAAREVHEETGIVCGAGTVLANELVDWQLENVYDIYPAWRHRYAPGVTRNTEHLFGLMVPVGTRVRLNPNEHSAWQWLPYCDAARACASSSNARACLQLPKQVGARTK